MLLVVNHCPRKLWALTKRHSGLTQDGHKTRKENDSNSGFHTAQYSTASDAVHLFLLFFSNRAFSRDATMGMERRFHSGAVLASGLANFLQSFLIHSCLPNITGQQHREGSALRNSYDQRALTNTHSQELKPAKRLLMRKLH
jgi:hypothetical protein